MASTTLDGVLLKGTAASRPSASAVAKGTIYSATDTGAITQSDGVSTWSTYATISGLSDPMTTRGDVIVRNASNVTARLAIGSSGKVLQSDGTDVSWQTPSAGGISSGTSFPGSPSNNDLYYRTDLDLLAFYDGTRWVTVNLYIQYGQQIGSLSADADVYLMPVTRDLYVVDILATLYNSSATPASIYWTATLYKYTPADSSTSVGSVSTINNTSANYTVETSSINAVVASSTHSILRFTYTKTSTPGNLNGVAGISYRLVLT